MTGLVTGLGLNLNNPPTYRLQGFFAGEAERTEIWLDPQIRGSVPILASYKEGRARATIKLAVEGSSNSDLRTKLDAVRDQFLTVANTIIWTPPGATARTFTTYPTLIPPADLSTLGVLRTANLQFIVPEWTIQVWRFAYSAAETATFKTPTY